MLRWLFLLVFLIRSSEIFSQEIPGLNYCTLFDSDLEKNAFLESENTRYDPLIYLLASDPAFDSAKYVEIEANLLSFVEKLKEKKKHYRNDDNFLFVVFKSIHKTYLKNYRYPETFSGIFDKGNYNCLSGSALVSWILTKIGHKVSIYQTSTHVFVMVNLPDSTRAMMETTDPINGFIKEEKKIKKRINAFIEDERLTFPDSTNHVSPKQVTLKQLAGLHYYNKAIELIKIDHFLEGLQLLKKASILFPQSIQIQQLLKYATHNYDLELEQSFTTIKN